MTSTASRKAFLALSATAIATIGAAVFAVPASAADAAPAAATPAPATTPRPVADNTTATAPAQQPSQLQGFSSGSGQSLGPMQVNPLFGGARPMQGTGSGKW